MLIAWLMVMESAGLLWMCLADLSWGYVLGFIGVMLATLGWFIKTEFAKEWSGEDE